MKKSKKSDERRPEEKEDFKFSHFITRDIALKFSKRNNKTLRGQQLWSDRDLTVLFVSFHFIWSNFLLYGLAKTVLTFSCKSFFTWNWNSHIFLIVLKPTVNIYSRLKISMGLCPLRLTWEEWRGLGRETERLPTAQCILQSRDQTTVEPTASV